MNAEGYVVALGSSTDLAAIPQIELAAARLYPQEDVPQRIATIPTPPGALRRACAQRRLWVARRGGRVVGFALGAFKDAMPYLRQVAVLPEHGGIGIGSALMRQVIGWARRRRAQYLTLVTFRHLPFNAPFYASLGFEEVPLAEQGPELREQQANEARVGIDPRKRVAMRLQL